MYELNYLAGVKDDYRSLDGSQKKLVNKSLKRIENMGMQAGQPLSGALVGCRKLKHRKAGLRVIFRDSQNGIEIIDIIAIGKREDLKVYKTAEDRMNKK
jgi:mRNA interferase RelE/StbE